MAPRWQAGIWLGKRFSSEEHLVGTADGSVGRSCAVKVHPDGAWDRELSFLNKIRGSPWNPIGVVAAEGAEEVERSNEVPRVIHRNAPMPPPPVPTLPKVRSARIDRTYLEKFGYTPDCRKCRAIIDGDESLVSLGHSQKCRERIAERMSQDPILGKRLEGAEQRQNEYLAKRVELGATPTKKARGNEEPEEVELEPGPAHQSEERGRSRAASTETYRTDVVDDDGVDVPVPDTNDLVETGHKRAREGPEDDGERAREDRDADPEDPTEVGVCEEAAPRVLMLGEPKKDIRCREGKFDLVELFSPPRVVEVANQHGLRGGGVSTLIILIQ